MGGTMVRLLLLPITLFVIILILFLVVPYGHCIFRNVYPWSSCIFVVIGFVLYCRSKYTKEAPAIIAVTGVAWVVLVAIGAEVLKRNAVYIEKLSGVVNEVLIAREPAVRITNIQGGVDLYFVPKDTYANAQIGDNFCKRKNSFHLKLGSECYELQSPSWLDCIRIGDVQSPQKK